MEQQEKPVSGMFLADKPQGLSSQALVSRFKRIYGVKSAGHTGTLDPIATGLNLICFGRATKVCAYVTGCDKEYLAELQLGEETDTGDVTGTVTASSPSHCTAAEVAAMLPQFTGPLEQIPPIYSAIKIGGRKMYELARAGKEVKPTPRQIVIHSLELLHADEESQRFTLRVACSKGTYIRSLCRDIGRALNVYGTMASLRRTAVGRFSIRDALTLEQLEAHVAAGDYRFVRPIDDVFADRPRAVLNARGERCLKTGLDIPVECAADDGEPQTAARRFYGESGEFLAVGSVENGQIIIEKRFFGQNESND